MSKIFKAQLDTPFGYYFIAVKSTEQDARSDMYSAAYAELPAPMGMLKIKGEIKPSNRRILSSMTPIKNASSYHSGQWAWIKKL